MTLAALFELPRLPQRIAVTPEQLEVLDLLAMVDGQPLPLLRNGQRVALRNLLAKDLVRCVSMGPATYLLTPIGRVVRGRAR